MQDIKIRRIHFNFDDWLKYQEISRGILRLSDEIDSYSSSCLLSNFTYIEHEDIKDITLIITSPGGAVYEAFAIYDVMGDLKKKGFTIKVIVEGFAASAAAMIVLQAASIRQARPNARFLVHEISRWTVLHQEKTSTLKDETKELNALQDKILEILAIKSNKSKEEVLQYCERKELWMSAQEALNWGLIDEII